MILSVSRRTDIPNYYPEWFVNRLREGFLYVRNPRNPHQISRVVLSEDNVDCIVFWTKNPANMMKYLDELQDYNYYFQFTLTGYGKEIEPNLPDKRRDLITTFQHLSEKIGSNRVIWRYDPIFLNERYTAEYHLKAFREIANRLNGYTEKVVISFVDWYAKMQRNTVGLNIHEAADTEIRELAEKLVEIAAQNNLTVESCAEKINLRSLGIEHGSCIDRKLIEKIIGCRLKVDKDKNQRVECGCVESIEVGTYNTCLNGCRYCYANFSEDKVHENVRLYDADAPLLCGQVYPEDRITDRKVRSIKETQISFFGG